MQRSVDTRGVCTKTFSPHSTDEQDRSSKVSSPSPIDHCSECVKLLGDYVDGQLPKDQAEALERHLSLCMPCITFLRTYKATGWLCRKKLAREMPPELKRGLSSFLAARVPGFAAAAAAPCDVSAKVDIAEAAPSAPLKKS